MGIHPTAIVEDGAQVACGVEIGPYCIVGPHVTLAADVKLHTHVVISGHTEIGARTVIYSHTVIGGEAQMRRANPAHMRVHVGQDNIIREGVTINAGSEGGHGVTTIGDRCYLMAQSHVGHDGDVGCDVTLSNGVQLGGHSKIEDGVIMGGLSAVQQFGRVGRYAFISGLSGVTTDVIPYGMAIGLQVRLGGLNIVGLRRRNIPRANIHALRAAYRSIFEDDTDTIHNNARRVGDRWLDVPEVQQVVAFILKDAKRPICPARRIGGDR